MTAVIHSGSLFFENHNSPYALLRHLEPGLAVDVGAAEGRVSRRMATLQPSGNVVAFEPFSANVPHFYKHVGDLQNVELRTKALGDVPGQAHLNVSSVLTGKEPGWEGRTGYASGGTLLSVPNKHGENVEVSTLDHEIHAPVRLLKIDVQGFEINVLEGSKNVFELGIDLIFVEYEGDRRILDFIADRGYKMIDSGSYTYSQKPGGPAPADVSPMFSNSSVASGRPVSIGPIPNRPLAMNDYVHWFNSLGPYALHTDILAVRPGFERQFMAAAAKIAPTLTQ